MHQNCGNSYSLRIIWPQMCSWFSVKGMFCPDLEYSSEVHWTVRNAVRISRRISIMLNMCSARLHTRMQALWTCKRPLFVLRMSGRWLTVASAIQSCHLHRDGGGTVPVAFAGKIRSPCPDNTRCRTTDSTIESATYARQLQRRGNSGNDFVPKDGIEQLKTKYTHISI